ncbi:MAG: sugar phosphate isomerase/epimerase family protein [Spirochaetales bacterium]
MMYRVSVCNEFFGSRGLEESFSLLAREGYQGVEVAPYTVFGDFTPSDLNQGVKRLRKVLILSGLTFVGFHWLMVKPEGLQLLSPDPKIRKKSWDHLRLLVELSGELGGGVLVLGSPKQRQRGNIPLTEANAYFEEGLFEVAALAQGQNSKLLLEALPKSTTDMVNTLEEVKIWVEKIKNPALQGMFDFHNTDDESRPWSALVHDYFPLIHHVHFNNRQGNWPVAFKEGLDPDYRTTFKVLEELGYEGWYSLEIFTVPADPVRVLREVKSFFQKVREE